MGFLQLDPEQVRFFLQVCLLLHLVFSLSGLVYQDGSYSGTVTLVEASPVCTVDSGDYNLSDSSGVEDNTWPFSVTSGITNKYGGRINVGVNYGMVANNLPTPANVVTLLQSISVSKAKLYDTNPAVLSTFQNTGITFVVGVRNEDLGGLKDGQTAMKWVEDNVIAHDSGGTRIKAIVVGNEVFSNNDTAMMDQVVPAMESLYCSLAELDLHKKVLVSTAHSFATVTRSFPPSAGQFDPAIATKYMKPVVEFLYQTGNPFFINVYPFFPYKTSPKDVSLSYALFEENAGVKDDYTGLHYTNMFDAQIDAVYSAISALGPKGKYNNISLLVSETGWPTAGDSDEVGATVQNAQAYHSNLIAHLQNTNGGTTPLRPNSSLVDVYLFALFNEDLKVGPKSERHYGFFNPDGSMVYDFPYFTSSATPSFVGPSFLRIFSIFGKFALNSLRIHSLCDHRCFESSSFHLYQHHHFSHKQSHEQNIGFLKSCFRWYLSYLSSLTRSSQFHRVETNHHHCYLSIHPLLRDAHLSAFLFLLYFLHFIFLPTFTKSS